jgi:hypothetical protein
VKRLIVITAGVGAGNHAAFAQLYRLADNFVIILRRALAAQKIRQFVGFVTRNQRALHADGPRYIRSLKQHVASTK